LISSGAETARVLVDLLRAQLYRQKLAELMSIQLASTVS